MLMISRATFLFPPMEPKPKVLVVDDTDSLREVTAMILESSGYRVVTAEDGMDALEKASAERFDLILMDVTMPVMNGYDAVRSLKADPSTSSVPVLFYSGEDVLELQRKSEELGAQGFLTKPSDLDLLLQAVEKHTRSASPEQMHQHTP